ncbi:MAG: type II toxin-antitoxin system Phd/YefM family antitoxin [Beijerinckiaceae bacterium]
MKTFPATDLKQNVGDVLDAASREPVAITRHNKPRYVIMSVDAYKARFPDEARRAIAIEEMPDDHMQMIDKAVANLDDDG